MWGGPAHYVAPLNATIETNVSGIRIGELLPLLVKQADKYALSRSMTHGRERPRNCRLYGADRPPVRRLRRLSQPRRGRVPL